MPDTSWSFKLCGISLWGANFPFHKRKEKEHRVIPNNSPIPRLFGMSITRVDPRPPARPLIRPNTSPDAKPITRQPNFPNTSPDAKPPTKPLASEPTRPTSTLIVSPDAKPPTAPPTMQNARPNAKPSVTPIEVLPNVQTAASTKLWVGAVPLRSGNRTTKLTTKAHGKRCAKKAQSDRIERQREMFRVRRLKNRGSRYITINHPHTARWSFQRKRIFVG